MSEEKEKKVTKKKAAKKKVVKKAEVKEEIAPEIKAMRKYIVTKNMLYRGKAYPAGSEVELLLSEGERILKTGLIKEV